MIEKERFSRRLPMRFLIASTFTIVFLTSYLAQAADPQLMKQLAVLQQQVAFLQKELNSLKGVVSVSPDGTIRITAQKHKQEVTGGNQQIDIAGNFTLRLSGSSAETVGGSQSITVGTTQTESIGQDQVQKIGRNMFQNAGLDVNIEAGKRTIISAGDQLILRTGQASIVLNKNGDITIQGKNIQIKGSADVIIKGSKVTTN
jgi:type VI secretion system secreted protein VgrG